MKLAEIPNHMAERHFKSQYTLLYEETPQIDFVGKLEDFNADFGSICEKFKVAPSTAKANKTSEIIKQVQYTKQTFELVADKFSKDIDFFDYNEAANKLYSNL